jgi:DNA polymerase-3 subunit epsilon
MRQVVLDTETTGLEPAQGHRIIEVGCVEMVNRRVTGRTYHQYLNPDREIDAGAVEVHGITNQFLADKPRFADVAEAFLAFVDGAELIIHNAPFDVGFIDHELSLLCDEGGPLETRCSVMDTLALARDMHPGQKNSLDALCKRYGVDNAERELHGALLDAQILADVYLAMTGGQASLQLGGDETARPGAKPAIRRVDPDRPPLTVVRASAEEQAAHREQLEAIQKASGGRCLWKELEA